jgi:hypothetical protein
MKNILYITTGILAVIPCLAEDTNLSVSGPVLGYVQRSAAVLPIMGIPGAAYFAPPVELGGLEIGSVSSESGYAILLTTDRTSAEILAFHTRESIRLPASLDTAVNTVRVSAGGRAAALLRGRNMDIVSGLPNHPVLIKTVEVPEGVVAFAISDDGEALALSDGRTISMVDGAGQRQLGSAGAVYDVRFRPRSQELLYIDGDCVVSSSSEGLRTIAGAADGLLAPRAALFSSDGSRVAIADASSETLLIAQPSSGLAERVKLPCATAELVSMNDSTLGLKCGTAEQVYLVQLTTNGTRVLFVPEPVE